MTGRGRVAARLKQPCKPLDPTLATRPVPNKRTFKTTSFGPTAAANTRSTFTSIRELKERYVKERSSSTKSPGTSSIPKPIMLDGELYDYMPQNSIVKLLEEIESCDACCYGSDEADECNPTWGFRLMLTSYDAATRARLDRAMLNLVTVTQRSLAQASHRIFAEEAFRRLRFEVLDDEETLGAASEDRVRAEFRAFVRGLELADEGEPLYPSAKNIACLALDEDSVAMLADLEFPERCEDDYEQFKGKTLKAVDVQWTRPKETDSVYRGRGNIHVVGLAELYYKLMNDTWMEALHQEASMSWYLCTFEMEKLE